jgi:ABC-type transport system substrate-binding protein
MPCYSNLVICDQQKQLERVETIVPELAERWSWQDNYRNLVFFLREDVKWHDGHPFTSPLRQDGADEPFSEAWVRDPSYDAATRR